MKNKEHRYQETWVLLPQEIPIASFDDKFLGVKRHTTQLAHQGTLN